MKTCNVSTMAKSSSKTKKHKQFVRQHKPTHKAQVKQGISKKTNSRVKYKTLSKKQGMNSKIINFFSALADETRLNILLSLTKTPKTVSEIHKNLNEITLSAVSHQLRQLSDLDIVKSQRNGKERIYSLSGEFCWCILNDAYNHFGGNRGCQRCRNMKHG